MDTLNYSQLMNLPNYFDYSKIIKINISSCDLKSLYRLNLGKFNNLEILYCDDNRLKSIDDISNCTSLQVLHCDGNQLSNLDGLSNCTSLKVLNCSYNQLENLDGLINCTSLQELYCQNNQLENLDGLINCTSLQELNCDNNQLSNLDSLSNCTSLQKLDCSNNKLSNLDSLSNCTSLQVLWCYDNKLTNLDCLSNCTSLQKLYCWCNQLTTLLPIRNLRNLNYVRYDNNPFEGPHHPAILRIFDRNKSIKNTIYSDTQNVHDSEITKSVNTSINNLMKAHSKSLKSENEIISKLIEIKFPRIEDLLNYFQIEDIHSYFNLTYFEIFQLVFAEIEHLKYSPEILRRLEEELNDASCMCFTGRISRTVNSLSGFSDLVSINISETSQINAVMSLIKNDFENNKIKEEELLNIVRNRLEEYDINNDTIEFYLSIFSEMYLE